MKRDHYTRELLERCAAAAEILSPKSFAFGGRQFSASDEEAMIKLLGDVLYDQCYCREFCGGYREFATTEADGAVFTSMLSTANRSQEKWDAGWTVDQLLPTGAYLVSRHQRYKTVFPGEFISADYTPMLPQPGTAVRLYRPKESMTLQPGFYFVFSNEPADQSSLFTLVRFYWNVRSSGAAKLVEWLSDRLNFYSIPFFFKCLNHPGMYSRIDAAVLYVTKPFYEITARVIRQLYPVVHEELDEATPWFTKGLAPGLALAEDPGNGESFGTSRCSMVARGIVEASRTGGHGTTEKMEQIETIFTKRGLSLDQPWLNAGSNDSYEYDDQ